MKIPGFITVRASSKRLPNKCFLPFGDSCNVLEHIIRRTKHFEIEPIVCTSIDCSDDEIERIAIRENVRYYRGSLINKLQRWLDCATYFKIEAFHTVDADDPFFDGNEMIRSFQLLIEEGLDMVCPTLSSSSGGASVGYSLTSDVLRRACQNISSESDTEMMWYYIDKVPDLKKKLLEEIGFNPPRARLTLDYQEDYWMLESIRRMVGNLSSRDQVNNLFKRNPDLYLINWFRNQEWRDGQLEKKI
jgi:spore coat polysaccharide biosynthesis protein SpsF